MSAREQGPEDFGEPILLKEERGLRCPVCGKNLFNLKIYLYNIKNFGNILMTVGKCSACGFKTVDVKLAEPTPPKKITVRVEGDEQLRYLVVKSAYSAVIIPEREYEMIPGPASVGFITTIEGLLYRFEEAVKVACKGRESSVECRREIEWIRRAIDGREKFTIIICDFEGGSKVRGNPEFVVEEPLDEICRGKDAGVDENKLV